MHISKALRQFAGQVLTIILMLNGSQALAQTAGTAAITIMVGEEEPNGCELLGKVKGSSKEDQADDDNSPYVNRLIKARNHLKIESQKLGGDTVHIIYSNNTGRYEIPGADKEIFHIGNVYRCNKPE